MMTPFYEWIRGLAESGMLPDMFAHTFMIRAVLAALIIAPIFGLVGPIVLSKKLAFFSTTIGHAALTGLSIGILLGEALDSAYAGTYGFCLIMALTMGYIRQRSNLSSDTVVGVFQAFVLGLGICLLVAVTQRFNIHQIQAVMFGDILTVGDVDLLILLVLGGLALVYLFRSYNHHVVASLNPPLAAARGRNVALHEYVFLAVLAILIVSSVKIVGAFLVEALVVVPAASARNLAGSLKGWVFWSMVLCLLGAVGGLILSNIFPVPSGGAIVLVLSAIFAVTFLVGLGRK